MVLIPLCLHPADDMFHGGFDRTVSASLDHGFRHFEGQNVVEVRKQLHNGERVDFDGKKNHFIVGYREGSPLRRKRDLTARSNSSCITAATAVAG